LLCVPSVAQPEAVATQAQHPEALRERLNLRRSLVCEIDEVFQDSLGHLRSLQLLQIRW
jgi:hypothetical protein